LIDAQNRHPVWIINNLVHNNPFYESGDPTSRRHWFDERYQVLMEINKAITAASDKGSLLSGITRVLHKVVKFDRADLALLDSSAEILRIYDMVESAEMGGHAAVGSEYLVRDSIWQDQIMRENRFHLIRDLQNEKRGSMGESILQEGIRSGILVPIIRNDKALGTLNIGSRLPNCYTEKDGELLMEVARQLALPIENLLAKEEIERMKSGFESDNFPVTEEPHVDQKFKNIVGQSLAIRRVLKAVETVAPTDAGILLSGETGTGKELIVHAIHNLSARSEKQLIKVNCAALPAGLIESELFGHEKGSYTGALSRKIGRFEMADGGTIFLDEIGDLHLDLQAKLLRVLQEGEFERVGGHHTFRVNVRVIAATNTSLENAVHEGKFRADLFYRLNVFPIRVPPLRERKEDIPLLVKYFVMRYGAKLRKSIEKIPQTVMDSLLAYSWPGNIRELENLIERAVIMSEGVQLEASKWLPPPGSRPGESRIPTMDELERQHITEVLEHTGWRVSGEKGAAKLLGMKPTTLEARMKKLGIKRK
jgi:formate hydrogenlyase transcriptional activator